MAHILLKYGIEFVEILWAGINGIVKSASRVNVLLNEKDYESIRALVPEATYECLVRI